MSHTPGEWIINDEGNVCLPNGDMIAWITSPDDMDVFGESPETRANARLIAAAPDMLAALRIAYDSMTSAGVRGGLDQMLAAINKAEGRE